MSEQDLLKAVRQALDAYEALTDPISELDKGRWSKDLSLNLSDIGLELVTLSGRAAAAAHVVHRTEPPASLDAIEPLEDETENAVTALVLKGEAGAKLHPISVAPGAGLAVGAETAAAFAFAHYRTYAQGISLYEALRDAGRALRNPYTLNALEALVAADPARNELIHVELSGRAQLSATAGWASGLTRKLAGSSLEAIEPESLGEIRASAKAGASVTVGVSGALQVRIDASPNHPGQVRVRLLKQRSSLVGVDLTISAEVTLTESEAYVGSLMAGLLEVPDEWVKEIRELRDELAELQNKLGGLGDQAKGHVDTHLDAIPDAATLESLSTGLGALAPAVASELQPVLDLATTVALRIEQWREQLATAVDESFAVPTSAIASVTAKLDEWIASYDKLQGRVFEMTVASAKEGITTQLAAGINRAASSEALLELDFDLETAALLCLEAMKGNFAPALDRARTPGATGVEIVSGVLKRAVKQTRYLNLKVNFLGFKLATDFQAWDKVEIHEDVRSGALSVSGQGGASLTRETNQRFSELQFLFDIYGAFEHRDQAFYTTSETAFRATLTRGGAIKKAAVIRELLPRHIAGATRLGLLVPESAEALQAALLSSAGLTYEYELTAHFPAQVIGSMFFLDSPLNPNMLRPHVWRLMSQAVELLDYEIPRGTSAVPLSRLWTAEAIRAVQVRPQITNWISLKQLHGSLVQDGAYRMAWAYLLNAHDFIEGLLGVRSQLQQGIPLTKATKLLRRIASKTVSGPGVAARPFDAKYLVFILAAGAPEVELAWRFKRGSVEVAAL